MDDGRHRFWFSLGHHFGQAVLPLLFAWLLFQSCGAAFAHQVSASAFLEREEPADIESLEEFDERRVCLNRSAYVLSVHRLDRTAAAGVVRPDG